jgi:ribose transport system substrate-binding protein
VLKQHPNIKVVATLEGNYDRDQSLKAMQDGLQANPKIDVVLSNADQQTAGAQIALKNANIDPKSVYLTGAGGTKEAVQAVRDGIWKADYLNFPVTQGEQALEQLVNALEKKPVTTVVDSDKQGPLDPFVDQQTLEQHSDFTGQWSG